MKHSIKHVGFDKLLRKLRDAGKIPQVTQAGVEQRGTEGRSAGENIMISRAQAKEGRRYARLLKRERTVGLRYWRLATRAAARNPSQGQAILMEAANKLARYMVRTFKKHIELRIGVKGVTETTQKYKDRVYGPGLPPLKATGQLLRSLKAKARVIL